MNGVPAEQAEAVAVAWRMHDWQAHPAIRVGGVLMRDELAGPHRGPRRVFWLLDEGVQLIYEPFGWIDEWYVDVVCIQAKRWDGSVGRPIIQGFVGSMDYIWANNLAPIGSTVWVH